MRRASTIGGKKVKFELVSEDDQADPKTATIVAQKLVDAKVAGVIGHLNSGTTIPASKIYADAGIPQISPSATNPKYTAAGLQDRVPRDGERRAAGQDAGRVRGRTSSARRTIAIIDDRTAYGQGLADEFEKAAKAAGAHDRGARIHHRQGDRLHARSSPAIKGKKPDLVFFGGMDPQAGPMVKQMRSLGIKAKFIGGDGVQTPEFIKLAGDAAEGAIASSPGLPLDKMPGGKSFADQFNAKYGADPALRAVSPTTP